MHTKRASILVAGITALALGVVAFPSAAVAQNADRPVGIGGKFGYDLTRVRGEADTDEGETINFSSGNGFSVGGMLAFLASPNVTIQPEFIYSQKKVKADVTVDGIAAMGEIDTDWFEIPVMAKFHGRQTSGARPFGMAGVTLSFLVNAKQTLEAMGMSETIDIKDELNSTDIGLSFGGGVDFLQEWGTFTVDARYTLGMRNLDDEGSVKQDVFLLSGGILF